MNTSLLPVTTARTDPFAGAAPSKVPRAVQPHKPLVAVAGEPGLDGTASSIGFVALLAAYRGNGGTIRCYGLDRLLDGHGRGDFGSLSGLIASGDVFGFEWRRALWIPMFQFDLRTLSIRRGPQRARAELPVVFDGWAQAAWFARRNVWLHGHRPADLPDADLSALLDAARADRFMAAA